MASRTEISAARAEHDIADLSIAAVSGIVLALVSLFLCVAPLTNIASSRDFVVFWATGQQLVHHVSPYDGDSMMRIERAAGLPADDGVLFMRNPPWSLPITLPLGLIGVRVGTLLWSLALLACLLISVHRLRRMHGLPGNYLHWLGASFAPALLCVMMGQTTIFALFGYVLFLDLHQRRPFLAGISLWLCALKPHLFILFGVVLLAWIVLTRSYRVLAGAAVAMAASCAIASCFYPSAWVDYARMMRTAGIESAPIPCLSVALRLWLNPHAIWLTYLPVTLGCAWALVYFWLRRRQWEWMTDGSLLMLVSLLTAPYSWIYDDGLAIPALLRGAYLTRSRILLVILAFASILIEAELLCGIKLTSSFYLWTTPAWLAWYLCAIRFKKSETENIGGSGVISE
jgi:hypothetical protein